MQPFSHGAYRQAPILSSLTAVELSPDWVSASRTCNFCLKDPLLDWLDAFGETYGFRPDHSYPTYDVRTDFRRFILRQGNLFEDAVVACLASRTPLHKIATCQSDVLSSQKFQLTRDAIEAGYPMIWQAVLRDPTTRTYGAADLLIRSDVLRELFPDSLTAEDAMIAAPGLDRPWHYRVIDIKFTTLSLDKSGHAASEHLPYMAQTFLYNKALGLLQGWTPPCAYLLGRGWKQGDARGRSCLDRLARVDVDHEHARSGTTLAQIVASALAWVRLLRAEGHRWKVVPNPSVPELHPNMSHTEDQPWHQAKQEIAREQGELTLLWQVGVSQRQLAHSSGIRRWTDSGCTASALGVNGPSVGPTLDRILRINTATEGPVVRPERVTAASSWRQPSAVEFYVDFETVSNLKDDFRAIPEQGGQELIFMIGCGHLEQGRWQFKSFIAEDLTLLCEARVIDAWLLHMDQVRARLAPDVADPLVFHWSHAESSVFETAYRSAKVRHPDKDWPTPNWFDLLKQVVKKEPLVVRGAMGFGLKSVAKALYLHGLIETSWDDGPTDGLGAMVGAWWCEDEAKRRNRTLRNIPLMEEIERYNEVDCRVLMEIVQYLRETH